MAPGGDFSGRDRPPQKYTDYYNTGRSSPLTVIPKNDILRDAPPPATNPWKSGIPRSHKATSNSRLSPQELRSLQPGEDNAWEAGAPATATQGEDVCPRKENSPAKTPDAAKGKSIDDTQVPTADGQQGKGSAQTTSEAPLPTTSTAQTPLTDSVIGAVGSESAWHANRRAEDAAHTGEQTRGRSQTRDATTKGKGKGKAPASSHPPRPPSSTKGPSQDEESASKVGHGHQSSRDQSSETDPDRFSVASNPSSSSSLPTPIDLAMLWRFPQGSDVRVFSFAPNLHSQAHRNVIAERSGWFRDNLPPPNQDGSPVNITANCSPSAVISSLYFMYTGRLEWCENQDLFDIRYLPQCVLSYCASVYFRIPSMVDYVLHKIKLRARELRAELVSISLRHGEQAVGEWFHFSYAHLQDAFDIAYNQPDQDLVKPVRLALAFVWDRVAPFLMCHSVVTDIWRKYQGKVMLDVLELRRVCEATSDEPSHGNFHTREEIEALLDKPSLKRSRQPGLWSDPAYFGAQDYASVDMTRYDKTSNVVPPAP